MAQTGADGQPLNIYPTHIVVGPALYATAKGIFETAFLAGGATNPNYGDVKIVLSRKITGNHWFLLDCAKPMRAVILQKRSETSPRWIKMPGEELPEGVYGFDARYNAGYGLHECAWGSNAA